MSHDHALELFYSCRNFSEYREKANFTALISGIFLIIRHFYSIGEYSISADPTQEQDISLTRDLRMGLAERPCARVKRDPDRLLNEISQILGLPISGVEQIASFLCTDLLYILRGSIVPPLADELKGSRCPIVLPRKNRLLSVFGE